MIEVSLKDAVDNKPINFVEVVYCRQILCLAYRTKQNPVMNDQLVESIRLLTQCRRDVAYYISTQVQLLVTHVPAEHQFYTEDPSPYLLDAYKHVYSLFRDEKAMYKGLEMDIVIDTRLTAMEQLVWACGYVNTQDLGFDDTQHENLQEQLTGPLLLVELMSFLAGEILKSKNDVREFTKLSRLKHTCYEDGTCGIKLKPGILIYLSD